MYRCSQVTDYLRGCVDVQTKAEKTKTTRVLETRLRYDSVIKIRPGSLGAGGTTVKRAVPRY